MHIYINNEGWQLILQRLKNIPEMLPQILETPIPLGDHRGPVGPGQGPCVPRG